MINNYFFKMPRCNIKKKAGFQPKRAKTSRNDGVYVPKTLQVGNDLRSNLNHDVFQGEKYYKYPQNRWIMDIGMLVTKMP